MRAMQFLFETWDAEPCEKPFSPHPESAFISQSSSKFTIFSIQGMKIHGIELPKPGVGTCGERPLKINQKCR